MLRTFILSVFLFSFVLYAGDIERERSRKELNFLGSFNQNMPTQLQTSLPKTTTSEKVNYAGGVSARISSSTYGFEWVMDRDIVWNYNDTSYSSFYVLDQEYNSKAVYSGMFSIWIFRTTTTAYAQAESDIEYAKTKSSYQIYNNKSSVTFCGQPAYLNKWTYLSSLGTSYVYNSWYFTKNNVVYMYSIFTTVSDWNVNNFWYTLYATGLFSFPTGVAKMPLQKTSNTTISNYPEPFNNTTTISFILDKEETVKMRVFSVDGRQVFSIDEKMKTGMNEFPVSFKNLNSGKYIVELSIGDKKYSKEISYNK